MALNGVSRIILAAAASIHWQAVGLKRPYSCCWWSQPNAALGASQRTLAPGALQAALVALDDPAPGAREPTNAASSGLCTFNAARLQFAFHAADVAV
eukprot:5700606-Pleurochrysis_carterae.AAC.3